MMVVVGIMITLEYLVEYDRAKDHMDRISYHRYLP